MLKKLNSNQSALISKVRGEYLDLFFSGKFEEQKILDLISFLYRLSGLDEPLKIVLDSPLALQFAANMLKFVGNQVRNQVGNQVENQVGNQVWNQVRNQVWNQVENQVGNQVRNQVGNQVRNQVRNQVGNQVRNQVRNQVGNQVWNQVRNQVWNLKYFNTSWRGTSWDLDWIAYYDYFTQIGICKHKPFNEYRDLLKQANPFAMIQLKNICFASKPPIQIKRDNLNNLHNTTDYAIKFADGYGQHYLWGIYFPPETFQKYILNRVNVKEVFSIQNQEQRAAIIKHYGYENILSELPNLRKIDYSQEHKATLYQFEFSPGNHPQFLMLEDFSSSRKYFQGCINNCKTALEALAASYKVPVEIYKHLKREY